MVIENLEKGYSKEEEYFHKTNKELIDKKRKQFDAEQSEFAALGKKTPHWMKCPKCGEGMSEIELAGIKIDQCGGCKGVYFDHGELEILIESHAPKGFLDAMKRIFS